MKKTVCFVALAIIAAGCSKSDKKEDAPSRKATEQKLETVINSQQPVSSYEEPKVPQEYAVSVQPKPCTVDDMLKVKGTLEGMKDQLDKADKEIDAGMPYTRINNAKLKTHMEAAKAHFENVEKWCAETLGSVDVKNCSIPDVKLSLSGLESDCLRVPATKAKINLVLSRITKSNQ